MNPLRALAVVLVVIGIATPLLAATPEPASLDLRFQRPLDLDGKPVQLVENESRAGTAFVFISSECPISRQYVAELNRLAACEASAKVPLLGVLSDRSVSRAAARQFADEFKLAFPVLFDATGELAELFQPTHVPQAFVVDAAGRCVYRGRIDDLYAQVDKRRSQPSKRNLLDAMTALAAGKPIEPAVTETVGCLFENRPLDSEDAEITYARDIAPILFANCVECHRPGQVAPFSLLSYEDAAKRAEWLSEVTTGGIMPPWRAEIGFGHFLDERKLTETEIALIGRWAKAGAPKGDDADLPPTPQFATGWRLGEPDLVLEAPAEVTVPADGPDIFHHWVIPIEIPEDKVLAGFEFRPGNPSVVHHALIGIDAVGGSRKRDAETPEPGYRSSGSLEGSMTAMVGVWTPGVTPRLYPENVGVKIGQKVDLLLQLHLHPNGKVETDRSQVALYFSDKPPADLKIQSIMLAGTLIINIPPGQRDHRISTSLRLPADVTLSSVMPHFHLIGKEMKIVADLPDGQQLPLVWIKDWNFYWQDIYVYKEPIKLPRGTVITVEAAYDNSADNPFNPRTPPGRVLFGNDSDEEMCFAVFQAIDAQGDIMRKMAPAMMTSFIKEWNEADLTDAQREHIVEEVVKLSGQDGGDMLKRLLLGNKNKPKQAPAE